MYCMLCSQLGYVNPSAVSDDDIIGNSPPPASLTVLSTTHVNAVSAANLVTVTPVASPSRSPTLEGVSASGDLQDTL